MRNNRSFYPPGSFILNLGSFIIDTLTRINFRLKKVFAYAVMPIGKKKSQLPCKHFLPVAGVGEQHINYFIPFDIFLFLSQRFVLRIGAIAIRCWLSLWTLP